MKLTIEVGQDEELRKEILKMIQTEIRRITGDQIKEMTMEFLNQTNVAAKATSAVKEFVNKQLDFFIRGYGDMVVKQEMNKKMEDWINKNFQTYFDQNVKAYIETFIGGKVKSMTDFMEMLKSLGMRK